MAQYKPTEFINQLKYKPTAFPLAGHLKISWILEYKMSWIKSGSQQTTFHLETTDLNSKREKLSKVRVL